MPGQLPMSVVAAAIGLNRGIVQPNLYNSLIVLAASSVFVSSMMFRYFSDKPRQKHSHTAGSSRTEIAWWIPQSRDR